MKKIRIFLFIFISLFLSVNLVYAECTTEEIEKYKELANNIRISYEYDDNYTDENNNKINNMFNILVTNLPKEVIVAMDPVLWIENTTNDQYINITKGGIEGGTNIKISYYTIPEASCSDKLLKTEILKLPVYNEFYNDELCNGIEDFVYCNKLISNKITYEGFKKNILKYKENLNIAMKEQIDKENNFNLTSIIKDNIIAVIVSTLIIAMIVLLAIIRRRRNRKI